MYEIDKQMVGDLRVRVVVDESAYADSPRDNDNVSVIYGKHRNYIIGDGNPPADEDEAFARGGFKMLSRYLRLKKGMVAIKKVGMLDHSGVMYYTRALDESGQYDNSLYGQFDSGTVGYAYVTKERLEYMGVDAKDAERSIDAEVKEYGQWVNGEVYGYIVDRPHCDNDNCPHAEHIDSCWGFIGDPQDCMTEGVAVAKAEEVRA